MRTTLFLLSLLYLVALAAHLPASYRVSMKRANAEMSAGLFAAAFGDYAEACRQDKRESQAWYGLGLCALRLGRDRQAVTFLRWAVHLAPTFVPAAQALGVAEVGLSRYAFDRAMRAGAFLYGLGRFREASDSYALAVNLDPRDARAYYGLAVSRFRMGDYGTAQKMANETIVLNPYDIEARCLLAQVDEQAHAYAAAAAMWQMLLGRPEASAYTASARAHLAKDQAALPKPSAFHFNDKTTLEDGFFDSFMQQPPSVSRTAELSSYARLSYEPVFLGVPLGMAYSNYYFGSTSLSGTTQIDYHDISAWLRPALGKGFYAYALGGYAQGYNPTDIYYRHEQGVFQLQSENHLLSLVNAEFQVLDEQYPGFPGMDSVSELGTLSLTQNFGPRCSLGLSYQYRNSPAAIAFYGYFSNSAHLSFRLRQGQDFSPQLDLNFQTMLYSGWPVQGASSRQDELYDARFELVLVQWGSWSLSAGNEFWEDYSDVPFYSQRSDMTFSALSFAH